MSRSCLFLGFLALSLNACGTFGEVSTLTNYLSHWEESQWLPLFVILSFVLGSALFVPLSVLIAASAFLLEPLLAMFCSFTGGVAGGTLGYLCGRLLGSNAFARWFPAVYQRLRERLSGNEVLSVTLIRNLPIAPFTAVNMAIGAAGVHYLSFCLGTVLGIAPFVVLLSFVKYSYSFSLSDASTSELGLFIAFTLCMILSAILINRLARRTRNDEKK